MLEGGKRLNQRVDVVRYTNDPERGILHHPVKVNKGLRSLSAGPGYLVELRTDRFKSRYFRAGTFNQRERLRELLRPRSGISSDILETL